ncbi:hypothetical protein RJ639_034491 [Escallonia herrerae]|uniref:Senescence regulator n=1 Tax=Escallonia herrerae TaxID=1293975 RepID=A0AA88WTH7_9ASTE|nr:hypothetical protein RJ639_034491 [Escallonia herrerae]
MSTRKNFLYHLGGGERISPICSYDTNFEFEESEIWTSAGSNEVVHPSEPKKTIPNWRASKKASKKGDHANDRKPVSGMSLPVNVPDWSKILRSEYKNRRTGNDDDSDEDEDQDGRIPPHEYLARTRNASFSVHEGVGRTLKGRDLSRVRNAIWKQTGFED